MVASAQDFTLYAGDDSRPKITIVDNEGERVDLEGASIRWKAVKQSDGTEVISKTTSSGGINIVSEDMGVILIKINSSDTEGMDSLTLDHEAEITTSYGFTKHVTVGTIDLKKSEV